jgi:hypothetical protein
VSDEYEDEGRDAGGLVGVCFGSEEVDKAD